MINACSKALVQISVLRGSVLCRFRTDILVVVTNHAWARTTPINIVAPGSKSHAGAAAAAAASIPCAEHEA